MHVRPWNRLTMTKAWILLSLFVLASCQASSTSGSQADSAGDIKYKLPATAKPLRYDLQLEPDLEKFLFTGTVVINLQVLENTKSLVLNSKDLNITAKDVTLVDEKKANVAVTVALEPSLEFLYINSTTELTSSSKYTLTVKFAGVLNDDKRGFYRSRYFDADNKVKYVAATHFEPTGARRAFPCFDEPAYKAVFSISLTHSSAYTAISNTPQDGEAVSAGKDKQTTKFKETPNMSSYLVAFVVSDYEHLDNTEKNFRVWTKPHAVNQARYALDQGQKFLEKLDAYTGIKYSTYMDKMDQVSLKDFRAGAMENWGLVTYRERSLLFEEGVTAFRLKQNIAMTIAHEFTHQWFGNLVSPKWWSYIWLNEGFADYFEYFIAHEVNPEWRLNETFVVDNTHARAFVSDASDKTRPMNKEAYSPGDIADLFDAIAYQKSGAVIRMMSHILTEDVFKAGLRKYLSSNALKAAEPADLLNALDEAANKKWEGKTFSELMNEWLNKPGYPVVNVRKNKDGDYEVSQEQFVLEGSAKDTKWWVPLTYVTESAANFQNTTPATWLKANNENLTIKKADKDGWIIFNTQQAGYYRVNYDEENWKLLSSYLQNNDVNKIHVLNRAQLIDDALNMARANRLNYTVALSLSLYLHNELDYIPWQTAFRNLNFLHNMMRTSSQYDTFKLYLQYITNGVRKAVGYKAKKEEAELMKLHRTNVMKWACRAGEEECVNYVHEQFKTWLQNSSAPLDIDLKNTIICAGLKSEDETAWTNAFAAANLMKDEDERKSLLSVMACSESSAILKKYLLLALENNSSLTFDAAVEAVVTEHPNGTDIVLDVFNTEYERIKKLNASDEVIKSCISSIGSGVVNYEQYVQLSTLIVNQGLQADLLQNTLQKASKNTEWIKYNRDTIESWLLTHEAHFSSASSLAFTSFLIALSLFITQLY